MLYFFQTTWPAKVTHYGQFFSTCEPSDQCIESLVTDLCKNNNQISPFSDLPLIILSAICALGGSEVRVVESPKGCHIVAPSHMRVTSETGHINLDTFSGFPNVTIWSFKWSRGSNRLHIFDQDKFISVRELVRPVDRPHSLSWVSPGRDIHWKEFEHLFLNNQRGMVDRKLRKRGIAL